VHARVEVLGEDGRGLSESVGVSLNLDLNMGGDVLEIRFGFVPVVSTSGSGSFLYRTSLYQNRLLFSRCQPSGRVKFHARQSRRIHSLQCSAYDFDAKLLAYTKKDILVQNIKDFAMQRAVQTLLFYYETLHEGTLFQYLEEFQGHKALSRYHGFRGLKLPWRDFLLALLKDQPHSVVVKKPARKQGTPGNPFVAQKFFEYTEQVQPSAIGRRLMIVRESVASEMQEDMRLIAQENERILEDYKLNSLRSSNTTNEKSRSSVSDILCDHDPAFNSNTPFRGGTFDLLSSMSTYFAVRICAAESPSQREKEWLESFISDKGDRFMNDAVPRYYTGRKFLKLLMESPPILFTQSSNLRRDPEAFSTSSFVAVEPMAIADRVMKVREEIGHLWTESLNDIRDEHTEIQREFLSNNLL